MKKVFVSLFIILLIGLQIFLFRLYYSNTFNITKDSENPNQYVTYYKNQTRKCQFYLPENFNAMEKKDKSDIKIVVMLHGSGENATSFMTKTKFNEDALSKKYAVLYLNSYPVTTKRLTDYDWHYGNDNASKKDIAYINKICRYFQSQFGLNEKLFAIGFSNGGLMINKLAANSSIKFTAVASVAGTMSNNVWENRAQKVDIGYLQINGTKDPLVPEKNSNPNIIYTNPFMEDVIAYYVSANNISDVNNTEKLSDRMELINYGDKVWWVKINDETHEWPQERFTHININEIILRFFDSF